jgi:hypothetical protein
LTADFSTSPTLGGNGASFLTGDIAEVIVYNQVLSPLERETVGVYLESKYGFVPIVLVAPTLQPAQVILSGQATLSWWPQNSGLSYLIERSTDGGVFTQIAEVDDTNPTSPANPASSAISYADTSIPMGNVVAYRIRAVSGTSISHYSNIGYAFASAATANQIDPTDGLSYEADALLGLDPLGDNSGLLPEFPPGDSPPPPVDQNGPTPPVVTLLTPSGWTLSP